MAFSDASAERCVLKNFCSMRLRYRLSRGVNLSVFRQAINTTTPAANADNKMFFAVGFIGDVRFLRR
jgi:hypothetical protein